MALAKDNQGRAKKAGSQRSASEFCSDAAQSFADGIDDALLAFCPRLGIHRDVNFPFDFVNTHGLRRHHLIGWSSTFI